MKKLKYKFKIFNQKQIKMIKLNILINKNLLDVLLILNKNKNI